MNSASDLLYSKADNTIILGSGVDQLTLQGTTSIVDTTKVGPRTNLPIDTITFAGQSIAGKIPTSGIYNGKTYRFDGSTLVVISKNNTLTIKGFHPGDFGVDITQLQCTPLPKAQAATNSYNTLLNLQLSPCSSQPAGTASVVFDGTDTNGLYDLWVTDGTQAGTHTIDQYCWWQ